MSQKQRLVSLCTYLLMVTISFGLNPALAADAIIAETGYLELLLRDTGELIEEAERQEQFERDKVQTAAHVYRLLGSDDPASHADELAELLSVLGGRRTIRLDSAAYEQILSSGHLQLISNAALRDSIVRHFAQIARYENIFSKNNQDLVDDVFIPFLMGTGISMRFASDDVIQALSRGARIQRDALGPDFVPPVDIVLVQPPTADSWNVIRRNVLFRMRIASVGQAMAELVVEENRMLGEAIAEELALH